MGRTLQDVISEWIVKLNNKEIGKVINLPFLWLLMRSNSNDFVKGVVLFNGIERTIELRK
jgi:hypothetical protein